MKKSEMSKLKPKHVICKQDTYNNDGNVIYFRKYQHYEAYQKEGGKLYYVLCDRGFIKQVYNSRFNDIFDTLDKQRGSRIDSILNG